MVLETFSLTFIGIPFENNQAQIKEKCSCLWWTMLLPQRNTQSMRNGFAQGVQHADAAARASLADCGALFRGFPWPVLKSSENQNFVSGQGGLPATLKRSWVKTQNLNPPENGRTSKYCCVEIEGGVLQVVNETMVESDEGVT